MKGRLLAGVKLIPAPAGPTDGKGKKPIPVIGTMSKGSTPEQIRTFGKMKRDMKKAARNIRYDQLRSTTDSARE